MYTVQRKLKMRSLTTNLLQNLIQTNIMSFFFTQVAGFATLCLNADNASISDLTA